MVEPDGKVVFEREVTIGKDKGNMDAKGINVVELPLCHVWIVNKLHDNESITMQNVGNEVIQVNALLENK